MFAATHPFMFDLAGREAKAAKVTAVLNDYLGKDKSGFRALDVGCSTGALTYAMSHDFAQAVGVDVDAQAIEYARSQYHRHNLSYLVTDGRFLPFNAESFDVVTCAHVIESVQDRSLLVEEVFRVLRPTGVCYFSAGNRVFYPKSDWFLSYWGYRKLLARFEIIDYTRWVMLDPVRFLSTDMITPGTMKHWAARVIGHFPFLVPNFIWLLKKND